MIETTWWGRLCPCSCCIFPFSVRSSSSNDYYLKTYMFSMPLVILCGCLGVFFLSVCLSFYLPVGNPGPLCRYWLFVAPSLFLFSPNLNWLRQMAAKFLSFSDLLLCYSLSVWSFLYIITCLYLIREAFFKCFKMCYSYRIMIYWSH